MTGTLGIAGVFVLAAVAVGIGAAGFVVWTWFWRGRSGAKAGTTGPRDRTRRRRKMMMEVVDELMTPGCPQCAIKHLSAALYHKANEGAANTLPPDSYMVDVCVAYINLVEVRAGYHSHLWYAVGALVRAEERFALGIGGCVAREARLMLEQYGEMALIDALNCIEAGTAPGHEEWAAAHYAEAMRELPTMQAAMRMDDLIGSIERIREEFFVTEQEVAVATSTEGAEGGGEEAMATKKAAKKAPASLKKDDPKAKQAACKGGKCKGKKCK